jgi:hypothetical protein
MDNLKHHHVGILAVFGLVVSSCAIDVGVQRQGGIALAIEGGGFRAQCIATSIVAGVAANAPADKGMKRTLANTGVLDRFGILSSNSGGSWFSSSLIYSSGYLGLVEGMINSPTTVDTQYLKKYINPWLYASGVTSDKFNLVKDIAEEAVKLILGTGDEDSIFMVAYFLATGFDWNRFVGTLLLSTANVSDALLLGEEAVMEWAKGKIWLVAHTVVLPSQGKTGILYSDSIGSSQLKYADTSNELTYMLPARFSVILGSGVNSSAPVTCLPTNSYVKAHKLNYTATSLYHKVSDFLGEDGAHNYIAKYSGKLPVAGVTSASSAFLGGAAILGALVGDIQSIIGDADMTPWIASAPDGKAFEVANTLIKQLEYNESHRLIGIANASVDEFAKAAVHGVIDGGYSDNTGIANAVAAGAIDVVVIVNNNATGFADVDILALFPGGGCQMSCQLSPEVLYPVFESPTSAEVRSQMNNFQSLDVADSQFLKFMSVGTVTATTTDNSYFGVQGSQTVTLHIINVGAALSIGYFEAFANYATFAQEIVAAILAKKNSEFVSKRIMPLFLGSDEKSPVQDIVV